MGHNLGLLRDVKVTVENALGIVDIEFVVLLQSRVLPGVEVEADHGDVSVRPIGLKAFTRCSIGQECQNPNYRDCPLHWLLLQIFTSHRKGIELSLTCDRGDLSLIKLWPVSFLRHPRDGIKN